MGAQKRRPTITTRMLLYLFACATEVEISILPASLDLGDVDITADMPDEGYYAAGVITLTNDGENTVALSLPEYETTSLCLQGFTTQEFPVSLGDVEQDQSFAITVGICGYPPGSDGSPVSAPFEVWTDGTPDTLDLIVTFTPHQVTG